MKGAHTLRRRFRRLALSALMAGLVAGCASHEPIYVKAGVTDAARKSDEASCVKASIGVNQPAQPATTAAVDRDAVAQCMQAKGYTLQKQR